MRVQAPNYNDYQKQFAMEQMQRQHEEKIREQARKEQEEETRRQRIVQVNNQDILR